MGVVVFKFKPGAKRSKGRLFEAKGSSNIGISFRLSCRPLSPPPVPSPFPLSFQFISATTGDSAPTIACLIAVARDNTEVVPLCRSELFGTRNARCR